MEALAPFPGMHPQDRPDIIDCVFKMKLNLMMDDIEKHEFFGPIKAGNNSSINISHEKLASIYYLLSPTKICLICSCLHY